MSYKIKINKDEYRSKLHGCWMGKAIGGAIGMPYELTKEINNATGFSTPKGEPVPNDDLDLQLVWLLAMEDVGPKTLSANAEPIWKWGFCPLFRVTSKISGFIQTERGYARKYGQAFLREFPILQ